MKKLLLATALGGLVMAGAATVLAAQPATAPEAEVPADAASSVLKPPASEHITVYVLPGKMGFMGPDHKYHDTIAPSDFVLWKGVPVTFTIINYDDGAHAMAVADLGIVINIKPGVREKNIVDVEPEGKHPHIMPTVTTFTFTPQKVGDFRWFCAQMCDGPSHWAMSQGYDGPDRDGFMAGYMKVL
jgi:hypothetical protein